MSEPWSAFSVVDPFNGHVLEGAICHQSGDLYGALQIDTVNGREARQLILCTPKLRYPFDKNGTFCWPPAKRIERYLKLDGTNIFAFWYLDADGTQHLSYKTRLMPCLRDGKHGSFASMWRDVQARQPEIETWLRATGYSASFELWGACNPHLIQYDEPLRASLLFVRHEGQCLPPCVLAGMNPDHAPHCGTVESGFLAAAYGDAQRDHESRLKPTESGTYEGHEGEVWYLLDETGHWHLFKCKPETIEKIHWSAGGLGKNVILATCQNAFENWDDPTVEQVEELLCEEFQAQDVMKYRYSIAKMLEHAKAQVAFRATVMGVYRTVNGGNDAAVLQDRAGTMRAMSKYFTKPEMKRVYGVLYAEVTK